MTIAESTVSGNFIPSGAFHQLASGISNIGTLTITNSTIANNSDDAPNLSVAGGIYNAGGR